MLLMNAISPPQKSGFLVGTAAGGIILNVIGALCFSFFAFFVRWKFPNYERALRRALGRGWRQMINRFRMRFSRAQIPDLAIDYMVDDLDQARIHETVMDNRQFRKWVQGNNVFVTNSQIIVQLNIVLGDNVDSERAQHFRDQELPRRHLEIEVANLLRGTKLISARFRVPFRVPPVSEEHAQHQFLREDLEALAEAAMMLDENATLQIGGLTFIHKDEHGTLTMSSLSETDVPIISSVKNFQGLLMITGCFLRGCEFKASTSSQCTNLRVFKEKKLAPKLEVVFAHVLEANELLLDEHTYVYAYKSVVCGAKSVIVRSESKLIKPSKWLPTFFLGVVVRRFYQDPRTIPYSFWLISIGTSLGVFLFPYITLGSMTLVCACVMLWTELNWVVDEFKRACNWVATLGRFFHVETDSGRG